MRDNVAFGLKMARVERREAAARVTVALERVGLGELAARMPPQLSGGQQQRVAVARALVNEPAVLLLDEPLGALDLKLRKRLQVELAQIHREVGTTFVFVTHDQEEAMALGDRIAVMHGGRIEQVGSPQDVYLRPHSRFVAEFIGDANIFDVEFTGGRATLADGTAVPAPTRPDGAAEIVIRPECVRVSGAGDGLRARMQHPSFLGGQTRLALTLAALDIPVTATLAGGERTRSDLYAPGQEVTVSWRADDVVVLDRTPEVD